MDESRRVSASDSRVPDRRKRIYHALNELVASRQQVLIAYSALIGLDSFEDHVQVREQLRNFCERLMDYVALEQFEIFDAIRDGNETRSDMLEIAERHYPTITRMNDQLIGFNDRYEGTSSEVNIGQLSTDLYEIGDILAQRIEEEDRFINTLSA